MRIGTTLMTSNWWFPFWGPKPGFIPTFPPARCCSSFRGKLGLGTFAQTQRKTSRGVGHVKDALGDVEVPIPLGLV